MSEPNQRLIQCFAAVFPGLRPDQIPGSSVENVPNWDSLATVTLATVLDQEFGAKIDVFDLPELRSFAAAQAYLEKHNLLA
jgi:acyl carrier protein